MNLSQSNIPKSQSFDQQAINRFEKLKQRQRTLEDIVLRKKAEYETVLQGIKEDEKTALEEFGTSDITALNEKANMIKQQITQKLDDFEEQLNNVEKQMTDNGLNIRG